MVQDTRIERNKYTCGIRLNNDFVDLGTVNTESLVTHIEPFEYWREKGETYRNHPFFTSALDTCPVIVAQFRATFLVGTDNLSSNISFLEERFHPFHL